MKKSLSRIQKDVDEFCVKRGWKNDDPNQLITSLVIEIAELAEHYQWKNNFKKFNKTEQKEIAYEFVDVLFYLSRLANQTGVDLTDSFYDKLPKLEKKFKVGESPKKAQKEYRRKGKNRLYD